MLAVFDFLVCVSALWAYLQCRRNSITDILAPAGFLLIAAAAIIGTARYAFLPELLTAHEAVSLAASVYGVPAIAIGFFLAAENLGRRRYFQLAAAALLLLSLLAYRDPLFVLLIGVAAQIIWILAAVRFQKVYPGLPLPVAISILFVSVAGLVFARPGSTLSIQNENWFHGLLAIGIVQQGIAFIRIRPRS